jgi:hypothetical protein
MARQRCGHPLVQANDVFLPWGRDRAGRIADERGPTSYYRIAEITIALSSGLTFALVGWEIVGGIGARLSDMLRRERGDRSPPAGGMALCRF